LELDLKINRVWSEQVLEILDAGLESAPRGMLIKEILGNCVTIDMRDPIVTVADRKMNFRFALGESWWILSGSNELEGPRGIRQFMKGYDKYSDDGITLNGAYGPKFVDQMSWVTDSLVKDRDSRQAVLTLWRERPGQTKDVPCTVAMQFLIRNGRLNACVNMRSNDMVWGFCYDSFTFSMAAKMIQTLLLQRGVDTEMGKLFLFQGSAHVYEPHWKDAREWIFGTEIDAKWSAQFPQGWPDPKFGNREEMLGWLRRTADELKG
jgi:thymidylate synthase